MSTTVTMTSISSHPIPPRLIIPPPPTPPGSGPRRKASSGSVGTLTHSTTTLYSSPPETPSTFGGRQLHNPPGQTSDNVNKKLSKSKSTSILGFLTVKEPSRLALEQYERDMKRKASEAAKRSGRPSNVNALAAPTAKLPTSVPKVNSKWDGLPKGVSERKKGKSGQGNAGDKGAGIPGRREYWRRLGNEDQASFATFGARHSGIGSRRRSQTSRDGSEHPWVRGYSHSGRSRTSTMNSPSQTSSSLGSWSVSSQSEAPSIMSDFTWDGLQPGRSGLSVREAVLKASPVTPRSQPLSNSSLGAPSSNSSRSEMALRSFGEGIVSSQSKPTTPLAFSGDLAKHNDETEGKQPIAEPLTEEPPGSDHDLFVPKEPLMTTALAGSRKMEGLDPPVSGNTEPTRQAGPQVFSNHSKARRVVARQSLVTPWESLEPPKTAQTDTQPPSPPCPVRGLLRRAKRKVFPTTK